MGEKVSFASNGKPSEGYFAAPEGGRGPAVVVIQECHPFAARVLQSSADDTSIIRDSYRRAFAREPGELEIQRAIEFLRETDAALLPSEISSEMRRDTVWAAFCQALLASNEFRYLD